MKRQLIALACAFMLACASTGPSVDQSVLAADKLLAALERGMTAYCTAPKHDADVCAMARKVDQDAFTAVMAVDAAYAAGKDPSEALANAQRALDSLSVILQGVR